MVCKWLPKKFFSKSVGVEGIEGGDIIEDMVQQSLNIYIFSSKFHLECVILNKFESGTCVTLLVVADDFWIFHSKI